MPYIKVQTYSQQPPDYKVMKPMWIIWACTERIAWFTEKDGYYTICFDYDNKFAVDREGFEKLKPHLRILD